MGNRPLIELGLVRWQSAYWFGMRQPSVSVVVQLSQLQMNDDALRSFDDAWQMSGISKEPRDWSALLDAAVSEHPLLGRLLKMTLAILAAMGMPVMGGAKVFVLRESGHFLLGLPAIGPSIRAPEWALRLSCSVMNSAANGQKLQPELLKKSFDNLINQSRSQAPGGINTLPFLQAAHEMGVPWQHVANNVYQLGWGSRSRWLDSSFTDQTSSISASLARDKVACAAVLKRLGLPVPKHQLVFDVNEALKLAQSYGYPVVVKPANMDGGVGVTAGVRDDQSFVEAYRAARQVSQRILVEQFVEGCDYRVRVCTGTVIGVVIRQAAAVVGDGTSTVLSLIEATNRLRKHQKMPTELTTEHGTKPIQVDAEVLRWLFAQNLSINSVVANGQRVRLRGAANVNLGGTTWDVTDQAHPDNLELALQAVKALRLDVAGVDLLLPDIALSYKETGGVICEVNAKPQFSSGSAHRQILERILPARGRIPVVGFLHTAVTEGLLLRVIENLKLKGIRVKMVLTPAECDQALRSVDVDALFCQLSKSDWPVDHLPVDCFDLLMIEASGAPSVPQRWKAEHCWTTAHRIDEDMFAQQLTRHMVMACHDSREMV